MSWTRETVVEKAFTEELAGERVGWITVHEAPANPDISLVNVATATVGTSGAALEYFRGENGEPLYSSQDDGGFENATSVYIAIEPEGVATHGIYRYVAHSRGDSASYLRTNGIPHIIQPEDKNWAHRRAELTEVMRSKLAAHGLEQHYPYVYYNLNIMGVGRNEFGSFRPELDDILVPDPAMKDQTAQQIDVATELLDATRAIQAEDELMASRLTVFLDIPADEIPDVFTESRERVANYEKTMWGMLPSLFAATAIYMPVGAGPGSRSWPYMDPHGKTPEESYGPELNALRARSTGRAASELRREINEAEHRVARVMKGLELLRRLNTLEQG